MGKLELPSSTEAAEKHLGKETHFLGEPRPVQEGDKIPMSVFAGTALAKALETGKPVLNNPVEEKDEEEKESVEE
jgi:hypothetical protein